MGRFVLWLTAVCSVLLTMHFAAEAQVSTPVVLGWADGSPAGDMIVPHPQLAPQACPEAGSNKSMQALGLVGQRLPKYIEAPQATPRGLSLGTTWYDLQTNQSMPNRVVLSTDGADAYVQVVWMVTEDSSRSNGLTQGYNNGRGSTYNFIDVSDPDDPVVGMDNWTKIEPSTGIYGWNSIAQYSDGSGAVGFASHFPISLYRNGGLGDAQFFEVSQATTEQVFTWPRVAIDGNDVVHLIYAEGAPNGPLQLVHIRSIDGGDTWDDKTYFTGPSALIPDGVSGSLPNGGPSDSYAIAARGNKVVVLYSDINARTFLRTSTDGGSTWNDPQVGLRLVHTVQGHTFIDSTLVTNGGVDSVYSWSDTVATPSHGHAVGIDSQGRVHMVTGQMLTYLLRSGTADVRPGQRQTYFYTVGADAACVNTGLYYVREDDSTVYTVGPAGGGNWDGEGTIVGRDPYQGGSRYPTLGFDEDDNVYLAYTSVKSGDWLDMQIDTTSARLDPNVPDELIPVKGLYGHIYLTHKLDGYSAWSDPVDVTPDEVNSLFASIATDVRNDRIHMVYQASQVPGDHVSHPELPPFSSEVMFLTVPTSELGVISSIAEQREVDANISVFPNPAHGIVNVQIETSDGGALTLRVLTVAGDQVASSVSPNASGRWTASIPTMEFATGVYMVVIEQNGRSTTRMMTVLH